MSDPDPAPVDSQPISSTRPKKPSTWLLVGLNACGFFALVLFSFRWPFGLLFAFAPTAIFIALSGIWHGIILLLERRWRLIPVVRTIAFLLPLILFVGLPYLGVRPPRAPQKINQQRPAVSPSGDYTAFVAAPGKYWKIRIKGKDGSEFEETTDFVGHLNVYWHWDDQGRLWVYNSDDGTVHFWHRDGQTWKHVAWGSAGQPRTSLDAQPPEAVFPDYAKDRP
jgi:hypothetical protein